MEYTIGVLNKKISDLKKEIEALEWHKSEYGLDYPKDFYLDKIKNIEYAIDVFKNHKIGFDDGAIYTKDGYTLCPFCKSKTVLTTKDNYWSVDAYPYKDQENTEDDIPDVIETSIEISGHYCLKCDKMITLNINR